MSELEPPVLRCAVCLWCDFLVPYTAGDDADKAAVLKRLRLHEVQCGSNPVLQDLGEEVRRLRGMLKDRGVCYLCGEPLNEGGATGGFHMCRDVYEAIAYGDGSDPQELGVIKA